VNFLTLAAVIIFLETLGLILAWQRTGVYKARTELALQSCDEVMQMALSAQASEKEARTQLQNIKEVLALYNDRPIVATIRPEQLKLLAEVIVSSIKETQKEYLN